VIYNILPIYLDLEEFDPETQRKTVVLDLDEFWTKLLEFTNEI
jgi:hypothetical protein